VYTLEQCSYSEQFYSETNDVLENVNVVLEKPLNLVPNLEWEPCRGL